MVGLILTRYPYEEPYHLNLRIEASNGRATGNLEFYCNASDLKDVGRQLVAFSGRQDEQVIYELGSESPQDRFAFYLSLRVKPIDSSGHCALTFQLNNNQLEPDREVSQFSIRADVADLNRLGVLFTSFGDLQHLRFEWHLREGKLFADAE